MKKLVIMFTASIILLSSIASFAGVLSFGHDAYRTFTTARGEVVNVQNAGVYRYSLRNLVVSGRPWDCLRLVVGIPILIVSFFLYLRGSLRGTVLFIGSLVSFVYQYVLWTFDWAYNSLFLVYVAIFSLSLWTLIFVLVAVAGVQVQKGICERFPVKTVAIFSFVVGGMLLLKCLSEILPGVGSGAMPATVTGYYTLVDQALDIGLLMPFCFVTGILLLNRENLGYLLSPSPLVLFLSVGLSVITGEAMLGLSTGHMNVAGIVVFSVFVAASVLLLIAVLMRMRKTIPIER